MLRFVRRPHANGAGRIPDRKISESVRGVSMSAGGTVADMLSESQRLVALAIGREVVGRDERPLLMVLLQHQRRRRSCDSAPEAGHSKEGTFTHTALVSGDCSYYASDAEADYPQVLCKMIYRRKYSEMEVTAVNHHLGLLKKEKPKHLVVSILPFEEPQLTF